MKFTNCEPPELLGNSSSSDSEHVFAISSKRNSPSSFFFANWKNKQKNTKNYSSGKSSSNVEKRQHHALLFGVVKHLAKKKSKKKKKRKQNIISNYIFGELNGVFVRNGSKTSRTNMKRHSDQICFHFLKKEQIKNKQKKNNTQTLHFWIRSLDSSQEAPNFLPNGINEYLSSGKMRKTSFA